MSSNASNASNASFVCDTSEAFRQSTDYAVYFTYWILVYPYFGLGVLGHGLLLLACLRQAKQESAYLYQIFLAAAKLLEITSFTILSLAFNRWAGLGNDGAFWYRSQYGLMWFAAHMNIPLVNGFINSCLFLSLCMAADRSLALAAPHSYRHTVSKHKVRISAFLISLLVGFLIVGFDTLRFRLTFNPITGLYSLEANAAYMASITATVLANTRNGILILAVLLLTACNLIVMVLFRRKMLGAGKTVQQTVQAANNVGQAPSGVKVVSDSQSKQRRATERTLMLLTICQSTLNTISVGFLATFFVLIYLAPDFVSCQGLLLSPILDATLQIASLLDFYAPLLVSKTFRRMVLSCHRKMEASVAPPTRTQARRTNAPVPGGKAVDVAVAPVEQAETKATEF